MRYPDGLTWDESGTSLFQPDQLLSLQFFAACQRKILDPERELMLAVLEDAITCINAYASSSDGKRQRLFREALDWILEEDEQWPFSFNNICEALRLDARCVRAGLLLMAKQKSNSLERRLHESQGSIKTKLKRRVVRANSVRDLSATRKVRPCF
jgi:hypothetical protein